MTIHQNVKISTIGLDALCIYSDEPLQNLTDCNHEEADTRIFIHVEDAYSKGLKSILICTVGTDVVVLAINVLSHILLNELLLHFGVEKYPRYISIHDIHKELSEIENKT